MLRNSLTGILLILLMALMPSHALAESGRAVDEYEVKAGFLYNFAKYITWPADAFAGKEAPFVIGVIGTDPFGNTFLAEEKKTVRNRQVVFRRYANLAVAKNCHILFIGNSERNAVPEVLKQLKNAHVLTVSDMERFTESGGMVRLLTVDGKIRFEVNLKKTEAAGLRVSSKMLKLATEIRNE